jgi:hypothetical protein
MKDLSSKKTPVKSVSGVLASRVDAWRYDYKTYSEVYIQVEDGRGNWCTLQCRVPRQ